MNEPTQSETALVLFSGGQDSATCLAWALRRFARVEMLGFNYGQRHAIELACRAISDQEARRVVARGVATTAVIPNADDDVRRAVGSGTRFFREWRG